MSVTNETDVGWLNLRVTRRWVEAIDTVAFELASETGQDLPGFVAGAYIDVLTPGGHIRPYSLCNSPADGTRYVIAVLKERNGRGGSKSLHECVREGDRIRVRCPLNAFELNRWAVHTALIAGGVGVTPLMSMAQELWVKGAPFDLHYSARNPSRAAFFSQLSREPFSSKVKFHWTESLGHIDFQRLIEASPLTTDVYVCGPERFTEQAIAAFVSAGRPVERLHTESFRPVKDSRAQA